MSRVTSKYGLKPHLASDPSYVKKARFMRVSIVMKMN